MLENPQPQTSPIKAHPDPFVQYARSLHDYTLRLWTESRRVAEEKTAREKKGLRKREQGKKKDAPVNSEGAKAPTSAV